jgi:hypothetical protein
MRHDIIDNRERKLVECIRPLLTTDQARALADRLFDLRACDLAVGSGALPSSLAELVAARFLPSLNQHALPWRLFELQQTIHRTTPHPPDRLRLSVGAGGARRVGGPGGADHVRPARAPSADTHARGRGIDERVYRLYALTPDEINLVEEATK